MLKIVRGECGCKGVQLDKVEDEWTHIIVLYNCGMNKDTLGFDQGIRNPVELDAHEAAELIREVAKAAAKGGRAFAALRDLSSEISWAKDTTLWGR